MEIKGQKSKKENIGIKKVLAQKKEKRILR